MSLQEWQQQWVGQNRIYIVYLALPKTPYIHRVYIWFCPTLQTRLMSRVKVHVCVFVCERVCMCVCVGGCVQTRCWLLPRLSLTQWRCFDFHLLELSDSIPLLYPEECSTYMHVSKRIYTPSHTHTHAKAHTHTHTQTHVHTKHTYIHTYIQGWLWLKKHRELAKPEVCCSVGRWPASEKPQPRKPWKWQR